MKHLTPFFFCFHRLSISVSYPMLLSDIRIIFDEPINGFFYATLNRSEFKIREIFFKFCCVGGLSELTVGLATVKNNLAGEFHFFCNDKNDIMYRGLNA